MAGCVPAAFLSTGQCLVALQGFGGVTAYPPTHNCSIAPTPLPITPLIPPPFFPLWLQKGAFSVAVKAGRPVVPVTLINSGTLMPNGLESTLSSTSSLRELPARGASQGGRKAVRIVVHPAITSTDADKLCEDSRAVIAEELKAHGFGAH